MDTTTEALGICQRCGRRMGWDGHRYGPCDVAARVTDHRGERTVRALTRDDMAPGRRYFGHLITASEEHGRPEAGIPLRWYLTLDDGRQTESRVGSFVDVEDHDRPVDAPRVVRSAVRDFYEPAATATHAACITVVRVGPERPGHEGPAVREHWHGIDARDVETMRAAGVHVARVVEG